MRNLKTILILVLAVVCGFIASGSAYKYLKNKEELLKIKIRPSTQKVAVATCRIPLGVPIKEEYVKVDSWLKESVPKGSFSAKGVVIGRVTKREIAEGEPILSDFLLPRGGILGTIPEGMRAMSIEVDEVISVHGFIQPGSYVDVIAIVKTEKDELISKTILQSVKVLAIGNNVEMKEASRKRIDNKITAVTLALSPQDTEKLALAINKGKIHLVLRNYKDRNYVFTPGISPDTLLGKIEEKEEIATYRTVEVIKGSKRTEEKFKQDYKRYKHPGVDDLSKSDSKDNKRKEGQAFYKIKEGRDE